MNIELYEGEVTSPTVIKVVGVGGGGTNTVNHMISQGVQGVEFIVVNTDLQSLLHSPSPVKIQIGPKSNKGNGAGGKPDCGEDAALQDKEKIGNALAGADMVFITAGMGGGTGTGAAPVIAQIAKGLGILTVGVVTKPFAYEGHVIASHAEEGIKKLRQAVDTLIVIPNENLFKVIDKKTGITKAFQLVNDILRQNVQSVSDLITKPGLINVDFADVRTIMQGQGEAVFGIGIAEGDNRAAEAANKAINNPLIENSRVEGAKNLLINVMGSSDLGMIEYNEIVDIISQTADANVNKMIGLIVDDSLKDSVRVILIATGFPSKQEEASHPIAKEVQPIPEIKESHMSNKEWQEISNPKVRSKNYLGARFSSGEDLEEPAILRHQRRYMDTSRS